MADPTSPAGELVGRTVGVTADRRSSDQAVMFARLGAEVIQAPVLSTVKVPDPEGLRRVTLQLADDPPDFVIANTGVGMRTWLERAGGWGLDDRLRAGLSSARIAARGPKAAGALTSVGLRSWWRSGSEQLGEVVERLAAEGLAGRTVAFQLHGDDGADVVRRLEESGATVVRVPVYEWAPPADPAPVRVLVERCVAATVDAVTFTAGPQVAALLDAAAGAGRRDELLDAFNGGRVVAGCIGPVCAGAATAAGIEAPVVPAHWRLGSLVKVVAAEVARRPRRR